MFFFVDRITEVTPNKRIVGIKNIVRGENFFYTGIDGHQFLNPVVTCQAGAQLGAWLVMTSTEFRKRVLLLGASQIAFPNLARPGDSMELVCEIDALDDDVVLIRTRGVVQDRIIFDAPVT